MANVLTMNFPADVGNSAAIPGCKTENCLRSHINKTETHEAMVMITKAGVEARQIVIGVSSYGRSFRMSDGSCTGPECIYTMISREQKVWTHHQ